MVLKIFSILSLVVPVCATILGLICWRYPPKGPNWALGYRSRRARASDASWAFAQDLAGKIWFILGLVLLFVSLMVIGAQREQPIEAAAKVFIILFTVQVVCLAAAAVGVDLVLMKRFDRFGKLRSAQGEPAAPEAPEEPAQWEEAPTEEETQWTQQDPEQWDFLEEQEDAAPDEDLGDFADLNFGEDVQDPEQ